MWFALILTIGSAEPTYLQTRQAIDAERRDLAQRYRRAAVNVRPQILAEARQVALHAITQRLAEPWQGTRWAFNGRSDTPQSNAIACGTYVGTLLQHAGFRVNRIALGRLASEHIALSLTGERNLRRYSDWPAARVAKDVIAWGPGLYLVGLDYHAGLVWVTDSHQARLIHSSVWGRGTVVSEPLLGDNPFMFSRYRVLAKLLDDPMMVSWLNESPIEARTFSWRKKVGG